MTTAIESLENPKRLLALLFIILENVFLNGISFICFLEILAELTLDGTWLSVTVCFFSCLVLNFFILFNLLLVHTCNICHHNRKNITHSQISSYSITENWLSLIDTLGPYVKNIIKRWALIRGAIRKINIIVCNLESFQL